MPREFLTTEERKFKDNMQKASKLKSIILGRGDDGPFSFIIGRNQRVVSEHDFVDSLVQAGFAQNSDEAREDVLPRMEKRDMCYKVARSSEITYSIGVNKVSDGSGNEAYRVSRFIG